jgi:hypothetical protein
MGKGDEYVVSSMIVVLGSNSLREALQNLTDGKFNLVQAYSSDTRCAVFDVPTSNGKMELTFYPNANGCLEYTINSHDFGVRVQLGKCGRRQVWLWRGNMMLGITRVKLYFNRHGIPVNKAWLYLYPECQSEKAVLPQEHQIASDLFTALHLIEKIIGNLHTSDTACIAEAKQFINTLNSYSINTPVPNDQSAKQKPYDPVLNDCRNLSRDALNLAKETIAPVSRKADEIHNRALFWWRWLTE